MTRHILSIRAAFLPLFLSAASLSAENTDFTLQRVGDGVWAAIVSDTGRAGGNAGFVVGDDAIAVIDTFEDPAPARELLAAIRKVSQLPIRFVINTHYHLDHVNGNDVFAGEGATVVAHRNVRAWVRTENLKWWGDAIRPENKARVESLELPDVVYDENLDLYLGERLLQVRFLKGHTGGDSVIHVPSARVVFCGDMLWKDHVPNLMDASTYQWIASLDSLARDYEGAVFIPGHGGIAGTADIGVFQSYLRDLRARLGALEGGSTDPVGAILPALREEYGRWGFFDLFAKDNIVQTEQELAGRKRVPRPVTAASP